MIEIDQLFKILKKQKKTLNIQLPQEIKYTAPFISEKCKL